MVLKTCWTVLLGKCNICKFDCDFRKVMKRADFVLIVCHVPVAYCLNGRLKGTLIRDLLTWTT